MPQETLRAPSRMLDFDGPAIQALIESKGWRDLAPYDQIGAAYAFVQNDIKFGYNASDRRPASKVLKDGYGQCNTKATLLMALLRAMGIACRLHGFTIHKSLQRGIVPELVYGIAPDNILHSWVEVWHEGRWVNLEGFILDQEVISALQDGFPERAALCGYGAGTDCLSAPRVNWAGVDTYIQKTGINQDFGIFDSPDDFYKAHRQDFRGLRGVIYTLVVRHWMNFRVARLRQGKIPKVPGL